jgi:kynureninase
MNEVGTWRVTTLAKCSGQIRKKEMIVTPSPTQKTHTLEHARALDHDDPLASFRQQFYIPKNDQGRDLHYFCGNSLGLQPKNAGIYVQEELKTWADLAVEGHFKGQHPWYSYHEFVSSPLASVVGGKAAEVVAMNSLTTNLHLLMASFYRPNGVRRKILIEKGAFPSDYYAVKSQLRFHGCRPEDLIEVAPEPGADLLDQSSVLRTIDENRDELALVMIGAVQYLTGQLFDIKSIAEAAHRAGAIVGFDCAHAAGNVDLKLHDHQVDFAVWCHYKYLNGGPGTIGGAFVHERHLGNKSLPRFEGWWGHNKQTRFLMGPDFDPMPTVEAWQLSNPPIFQLAALRASVEIFSAATMAKLREKSKKMTSYLESLLTQLPEQKQGSQIAIITPSSENERGAQLSLRITEPSKIFLERMQKANIICDFRQPNVVRVAPAPLYNSFQDVYHLATHLKGNHL